MCITGELLHSLVLYCSLAMESVQVPHHILDLCGVGDRPLRSIALPLVNDGSEVGIPPPLQFDIQQWHAEIRARTMTCPGQRTVLYSLPKHAPTLAPKLLSSIATRAMPEQPEITQPIYDQLSIKDHSAYCEYLQKFFPRRELEASLSIKRYLRSIFALAEINRGSPLYELDPKSAALRQELAVFAVMLAMGLAEVNSLHALTSLVPLSVVKQRLHQHEAGTSAESSQKPSTSLPLPHPTEILANEVNHISLGWLAQVPHRISGASEFKFLVAKDPQAEARAPRGAFPYFAAGDDPFLRFAEVVQLATPDFGQEAKSSLYEQLTQEYSYQGWTTSSILAMRRRQGQHLRAKGWVYAHEGSAANASKVAWDLQGFPAELKADKYVEVWTEAKLMPSQMTASASTDSASHASASPQAAHPLPLTLFSRKIRDATSGKGLHLIVSLADTGPWLVPNPSLPLSSRSDDNTRYQPLNPNTSIESSPLGFLEPILNPTHMQTDSDDAFRVQCSTAMAKLQNYVHQNNFAGGLLHVDRMLSQVCCATDQLLPVLREQLRATKCLQAAESQAGEEKANFRQTSCTLPFSAHLEAAATCAFEMVNFALRTLSQGGLLVFTIHEIISPMSISLIFLLTRVFEEVTLHLAETGMPIGASQIVVVARHLREFRPEWALHIFDKLEAKLRSLKVDGNEGPLTTFSLASTWLIRPCEAFNDTTFVQTLRKLGYSFVRQEAYILAQIARFALVRSRRRLLQPIPKRPFGIVAQTEDEKEDGADGVYDPITSYLQPHFGIGAEHVLLPFPPLKQERRQAMEGTALTTYGMWVRLSDQQQRPAAK